MPMTIWIGLCLLPHPTLLLLMRRLLLTLRNSIRKNGIRQHAVFSCLLWNDIRQYPRHFDSNFLSSDCQPPKKSQFVRVVCWSTLIKSLVSGRPVLPAVRHVEALRGRPHRDLRQGRQRGHHAHRGRQARRRPARHGDRRREVRPLLPLHHPPQPVVLCQVHPLRVLQLLPTLPQLLGHGQLPPGT